MASGPEGLFQSSVSKGGEGVETTMDGKICIDSPAKVKVANGVEYCYSVKIARCV